MQVIRLACLTTKGRCLELVKKHTKNLSLDQQVAWRSLHLLRSYY